MAAAYYALHATVKYYYYYKVSEAGLDCSQS
jgi:hypothetical protein